MAAYTANEVSTVWRRALGEQQPHVTKKISETSFWRCETLDSGTLDATRMCSQKAESVVSKGGVQGRFRKKDHAAWLP